MGGGGRGRGGGRGGGRGAIKYDKVGRPLNFGNYVNGRLVTKKATGGGGKGGGKGDGKRSGKGGGKGGGGWYDAGYGKGAGPPGPPGAVAVKEKCNDFLAGRCMRGANCRYAHN